MPFVSAVPPRLFDITDPLSPVELLGGTFSGGTLAFEDTQAQERRYLALPDSIIKSTVMPATDILEAPFTSLATPRHPGEG